METIASKDPRAHTANVRKEFRELIEHLRGDINKIDEPKAQALFETTAEVISGLDTAFKHYEEKSENAWKYRCIAASPRPCTFSRAGGPFEYRKSRSGGVTSQLARSKPSTKKQ